MMVVLQPKHVAFKITIIKRCG